MGLTGVQRARTAVFAVLATALALLAHLAGGGSAPGTGSVLVVVLVSGTAGSWLASRRPGAVQATVVLGLVQALTHVLFAAGAPISGAIPAGHGTHPTTMWLAHAVAVVATAWLLTRGEQAVEALLTLVLPDLPGRAGAPVPAAGPRAVPAFPLVPALGRVVAGHLTRRGPPGSTAVTS